VICEKENYLLYFLAFAGTLFLLFAGLEFAVSGLFIAVFILFFVLRRANRELTVLLLTGFAIRGILAFMGQYLYLFSYGWDDFYSIALQIKDNLVHGIPILNNIQESAHAVTYSVIGAHIYYVFGDFQILMRLVNCFLGTMVADRVYSLAIKLTNDKKAAKIAAILSLFFPSFIVFSSLDMRDSIIFFLTVEMLYRISLLMTGKRARDFFFLALDAVGLYFLRTQYLFLFTLIVLVYWLARSFLVGSGKRRWAIIFVLLLITSLGYFYLQKAGFFNVLFKAINADMAWRTSGGSAYLTGMSYESWWDVVRWMPLRMIHFTFGPFVWNINNAFLLLAAIESIVLMAIVVMAFSHEARKLYLQHPRLYLLLLIFAVVGLLSSAAIDSNYGTAIRHKMNFIFIFFIFSATYLKKMRLRIG
jgi:hypothetical protein